MADLRQDGGTTAQRARHADRSRGFSRKNWTPGTRWAVFVALVVLLGLFSALCVPRLLPQAQTILSGSATPQGRLTLGLADAPDSLDIRTKDNTAAARVLVPNVYEGLTARDAQNKAVPALASSWDVSKDAKTYTFHLRNAVFSDGSAMTSADVLDSFHTATSKKLPGSTMFDSVKSMSAPDDHTVRMSLHSPDPQLLWHLSTAPAIICKRGTTTGAFTAAGRPGASASLPAGTGPYTAGALTTGSAAKSLGTDVTGGLTLTATTGWWGGNGHDSARPRTITVRWYADSAHLRSALSTGRVQAAADLGPDTSVSLPTTKFTSQAGDSTARLLVTFNSAPGSLLSDRIIREAHARTLMGAGALQAYGDGGQASDNLWPVSSLDPGYQNSDGGTSDFNPTKYTWLASAYSRRTTMAVAPDVPQKVVDALTAAEQKAGFSFTATRLTAQQWKEQVTSSSADRPMGFDMAVWIKHGSHDLNEWMTGSNWWDFDSTTADSQYRAATTAASQEDFEKGVRTAAQTLLDAHPAVWLLQLKTTSAWKTSLALTGMPTAMTDIYLPLSSVRLG